MSLRHRHLELGLPPLESVGRRSSRLGVRLTRAAMAAAGLALTVVGLLLNVVLHLRQQAAMVDSALVQARVIGDALAPTLVFEDRNAAADGLKSLHHAPELAGASLLDNDGHLLAGYRRPGEPAPLTSTGSRLGTTVITQDGSHTFHSGRLWVRQPVHHLDRRIGTLQLSIDLAPLYQRTAAFVGVTALACLAALGLAYAFVIGVRRDVQRTEDQLDRLAFIDAVTGLYNRHAAGLHLGSLVSRASAERSRFYLLLLDLDDFKLINDTLGHEAGDQVLRELAARLRRGLADDALVFRFGGDEFVIVVDDSGGGPQQAHVHGHDVVALLQAPLLLGSAPTYLRGSVGVAVFPDDGDTVESLLRAADAAMYQAKAAGKNLYMTYRAEMGESLRLRARIEGELRQALERHELRLHYQPIVNLASGRVIGCEALVRWQHPQRGLLMPGAFIDVAEASDLILDLGGWVLNEAARQLAAWQAMGHVELFVAVNASALQVSRGVLTSQVLTALARHGVARGSLEVEITESMLLTDAESNVAALQALRAEGIRLAVDDFGTGQSSLSYLKRLPVDKFKIDRCFVQELGRSRSDLAIVTAVLAMAQAMGLEVVAEGVEREEQRALLHHLGCTSAQGWLFSKALPPDALLALLQVHRRVTSAAD